MNRKMILYIVGQILKLESVLMLFPAMTSLCYSEYNVSAVFLCTAAASLLIGILITLVTNTHDKTIFAKEGFIIVAVAWVVMSLVGAIPFRFTGEIPSYIDAFFETVSGFTTTGASIVRNVEELSHGILFWRSFTHWVGGMGVLVMIMAIIPAASGRSIHIMRAEMPGPIVGKLVPKLKDTAKILYLIYIVLTLIEVMLLLLGGMNLFESLVHTFGTAGTGGFGIKANSLAGYSPYNQWVITIFMLIFGVNFNLYFLLLMGKIKSIFKSGELWCYLAIYLVAAVIITLNIYPMYNNISEAVRLSAFQTSSIMTTTGFSTADFNSWPVLSKSILLLVMFVGGCAGSTAGGIKVSRIMLIFKIARRDLKKMLHPRSVGVIKLDGKVIDEQTINTVHTYGSVYFMVFAAIFMILSFDPGEMFDIESNFSAVAACYNNIGPGLGAVGPMSSYADYSVLSKLALSAAMLFGRLELFPMIFIFTPTAWSNN